ncbi:haloacid dehalogenase-like hydrolase family protein [Trichomonas vaginalis G3]|uniref:Haloacid dehalogenase-like hydrolase family protein n=1 Tax=Trichomonas vaginalis (strain ATCC PRA-98 / G3) TaxID=412133 RepID=A2ESH7_TRIV3|nr:pseudouridine 5'-phosphatase protein [Trichomonas vaginalis G3]EAY04421.1 haloacid dehalogenase-like hydrolase family protein [Trichomonas vaginalis G3]KAI5526322.1 pseudouridine 5'-phosphatase protein [Trichomonas vaginalis G3]|eukprot:XP_001316644.1 haloacid dehalogenase-like hydrolase family protein [Trichomonas vaginalis G3]
MKTIRCVICDVDGLLIDSEGIFAKAIKHYSGHELTQDLHLAIMGTTGPTCGKILMKGFGLEGDPIEWMQKFDIVLNGFLKESDLMPGARQLVKKFHEMRVPIGIATGSNRCNLEAKCTKNMDLLDMLDTSTCGNEVTHGKPNPEIFLTTMKKLGIDDPTQVLVFEDAPTGVKAAISAGMQCIMVPDKSLPYQKLLDDYGVKPTLMLDSLEQFDFSMYKFINKDGNVA